MSKHASSRHAYNLVVALKCALELYYYSLNNEFDDRWELRIQDSNQCCIYVSEVGRSHLGFHNSPREEPLSSQEIFVEELQDNVLDVGSVYLIDNTIDRFPQHFPHILLMFQRGLLLILEFLHHLPQLEGRNVDTTSFGRQHASFELL